ncbi:hypothetical protein BB559_002923 [Furculomyces boomerangus]|uniref:DNL-type domain-containing protein n=2 Tax=Harpellales TaxID=61421 RepID=A0A2T9YR43_9FUNG|nr:hypothetical protein BB559_002923 [Furculomyces boomerangus]PWA01218.1 hypothetical protein BB558_002702 [Smittium angustum]
MLSKNYKYFIKFTKFGFSPQNRLFSSKFRPILETPSRLRIENEFKSFNRNGFRFLYSTNKTINTECNSPEHNRKRLEEPNNEKVCTEHSEDSHKGDAVKEVEANKEEIQVGSERFFVGFTCKVCDHRQYKTVSKKAYTSGVVLIKCDGCQNRHLFADHLGWFRDGRLTVEDLMRENGEEVKKVAEDGLFDYLEGEAKEDLEKLMETVLEKKN